MHTASYQQIDPAVLMRLAGDRSTFRVLSQTFMEHAPELFRQLVGALQRADYTAIGRLSHALKGMTTLVGADRLTTLLQTLELAARAQQPAEATELGQLFVQVLTEVSASVEDDGIAA
ncbi:Hpt domain-containing protein [Duganella sacchari]|uniref:Hpt domain-containing protein n=1 Tax=Duganella sacchari TaxID=551987 RepID=A0A1M7KQ52_9BURK|nr:Hpt domain-containing protein [Duganella sacchari]SHM67127.1 Hpt domain-containing protein [Duganella sacchari]